MMVAKQDMLKFGVFKANSRFFPLTTSPFYDIIIIVKTNKPNKSFGGIKVE
jgi:hypothetical protein